MSIIESAFLKSKEKSKGKSNSNSNDGANEKTTTVGASEQEIIEEFVAEERRVIEEQQRDPTELGTARKEISQMAQGNNFTAEELAEKSLISANMKDSVLINKYRNLRTNLLTSSEQDNFVTLVTSVSPSGDRGSSMVATNLAATFALDEGKTSLLIDANINNPQLCDILSMTTEQGLIDYLESDDCSCEDVLHKTPIPRLRLLPCGQVRVNAAEYFTSQKMKSLIKDLVSRYPERFPIINAPSISDSADARILIELVDKVILVVPYGKCSKEEIKYAAMAVGNEKLAGIILNEF